jgi:hypothetical protein
MTPHSVLVTRGSHLTKSGPSLGPAYDCGEMATGPGRYGDAEVRSPRINVPGELSHLIAFTGAARRVIAAACTSGSQQAILVAWPAGAAYLPHECYVPTDFDVVLGFVEGCPVYADSRRLALFSSRRLVLDADACSPSRPHPPLRPRGHTA